MPVATDRSACPLCGGSLGAGDQACPHCKATPQWRDYARALLFSRDEFADWRKRGLIGESQFQSRDNRLVAALHGAAAAARDGEALPADISLASPAKCWRCERPIAGFYSYCNTCGAPLGQAADTLRYLGFLSKQVTSPVAQDLTLTQIHACTSDIQGHIAALRAELERGRLDADALAAARLAYLRDRKSGSIPEADPPVEPPPIPVTAQEIPHPSPHRSILEILLDPRSIQWLLASGGVLLVVGLVIWLASLGLFKNALVVAVCMGAGTVALLAGGCAVVKFTRFQLAGRAITLLACLVMPLNLWFYHAHDLVTLDGHLWAAGLVCCALYAAAAAVLEDSVFVYVLSAGVAMTGLLILADLHRLMEIAAPSTLLIALGMIALHTERAFADNDGSFSRKRFGMACFWSAQALLGAGLFILLAAQFESWLPVQMSLLHAPSAIAIEHSQRLLALCLVLAGAYAYLYSDLVVRRVGVYVYLAAFNLLWAELLGIDLLNLADHPSVLIAALALTSLAVNIAQALATGQQALADLPKLTRPLSVLGIFLSSTPVLFGLVLHLRAVNADVHNIWPYTVTWAYVGAMALTAICCRISAYFVERRLPRLASAYLGATAAVTLVGAAALLWMLGLKSWPVQSPILMVIPILYLLASRLYVGRPAQYPLMGVAQAATGVLIAGVLFSALQIVHTVEPVVGVHTNLLLSLFCAEAAVFYVAAAVLYGGGFNVYLATAMACGSVWQLLNFWDLRGEYYCVTFAVLGMAMLIAYRMALMERVAGPSHVVAAFRCANGLMSLSFIAAALMALSRLALDHTDWPLAILMAVFSALGLLAAGLVRVANFRRWYVTVTVAEAALAFLVLQQQIHLNPWQHVEMFCVGVGLVMLICGYSLWYREQDRQSDSASFCLLFGSLLAGVPLVTAAMINRFGYQISLHDEIGLATISTLMFVTGFMCRLRAPTLVGGSLLVVHLGMLLVFVGMRAQLAVGVYLTIGGVILFGLGVLLSIYRDRLLALPQHFKQHEGLFRVLAWR